MKQIANLYIFDASARSLSITGLSISQARLLLVVNASRNEVLYNFAGGPGVTSYALEGGNTVLHLLADTTSHADTDALTIFYEDGLSREESLTITDLQTIQGSLPAAWLTGAEVPVAGPLTDTQLRAQMDETQSLFTAEFHTTQDAITVLNQDLNGLKTEVKAEFDATQTLLTEFKNEVKAESDATQTLLQTEFDQTQTDLAAFRTEVKAEFDATQTLLQTEFDAKLPALASGRIPVDVQSIVQVQVSVSAALLETTNTLPTTSSLVLPANASRRYLFIQNLSSAAIHLSYGGPASLNTLRLDPRASLTFEGQTVPTNAIAMLPVQEGQKYYIAHA